MQYNQQKQIYLIKQTNSLKPLGQMQKEVYGSKRNEVEWLRNTISGLEATPTGKLSDLWKQLNALSSLQVSNSINANRKIYFQAND